MQIPKNNFFFTLKYFYESIVKNNFLTLHFLAFNLILIKRNDGASSICENLSRIYNLFFNECESKTEILMELFLATDNCLKDKNDDGYEKLVEIFKFISKESKTLFASVFFIRL